MTIPADDSQNRLSALEQMARHAGACEALLRACRFLRLLEMHDAANVLIENVPNLVESEKCTTR